MSNKKKKKPVPEKKPDAPKRTRVEHRGYTAVQSGYNHHIMIGKDGKVVSHVHATRRFTEAELKNTIDEHIALRQQFG